MRLVISGHGGRVEGVEEGDGPGPGLHEIEAAAIGVALGFVFKPLAVGAAFDGLLATVHLALEEAADLEDRVSNGLCFEAHGGFTPKEFRGRVGG